MSAPPNAFQAGHDYISFDAPSPPAHTAAAGPSRLHDTTAPTVNGTVKGKGKARETLDAEDDRLLAAKNGRRDAGANPQGNGDVRGKGKGKSKGKGKGKDKGKGKEPASRGQGDRKRSMDEDTGPRNLKEERKAAERHAPWADVVDWEGCHDPAEMLNSEIDAYYRYVSPSREEFEVRLFMIELITRAVHRAWPDAEVSPFGSWQTQLYLPSGDIDLVVSNSRFTEASKSRLLAELARAMRMAHITDVVAIISKARVPIIKFVTTEGKLNVDISLNQINGISAGKIINQYLEVLPGARQLIMVVKAFLSQRSMNEVYTGGIGSYAVICLVHPKLRRSELDPEQNLGTLLIEFFELYGRNFNYDDVGLSIRRGGFYFNKRSRGWYRAQQPFLLSIEDPQDRDNDISSGSFGVRQVKNTLAGAYEMLQARLFQRAELIAGRKSGRLSNDMDPDEMSILAGVMGITKETQRHRQQLQRLHSEGRLQRMLNIPPGANPENHVRHYRPPHLIGVKRPFPSAAIRRGAANGDVPSPNKRRRGSPRVGAILVDDEDEMEDGEYAGESDVDELDEEDEDEDEESDEGADEDDDGDDDDEEGEIVEVFPNGRPVSQGRFESVSHDEDADEDHARHAPISAVEVDDDSRYALGASRPNGPGGSKRRRAPEPGEIIEIGSSDSDSDSDVVAIERPGTSVARTGVSGGPSGRKKMDAKQRRDFWAAKGRVERGNDDDDADGFEGGADFVGLD